MKIHTLPTLFAVALVPFMPTNAQTPAVGLQIGMTALEDNAATPCTSENEGVMLYSRDYHGPVFCDGTEWRVLSSFPYAPERMDEEPSQAEQ